RPQLRREESTAHDAIRGRICRPGNCRHAVATIELEPFQAADGRGRAAEA
nr:hypothetical protein [Tanacetum cinerariifolium]